MFIYLYLSNPAFSLFHKQVLIKLNEDGNSSVQHRELSCTHTCKFIYPIRGQRAWSLGSRFLLKGFINGLLEALEREEASMSLRLFEVLARAEDSKGTSSFWVIGFLCLQYTEKPSRNYYLKDANADGDAGFKSDSAMGFVGASRLKLSFLEKPLCTIEHVTFG